MRYAQGGGLTDERRAFREKLRMEAAERFAQGDENPVIAHDLRVSVRSVQRWRRAWSQDGPSVLASKGPASLPLLRDELFAVLEQERDRISTVVLTGSFASMRELTMYLTDAYPALRILSGQACEVPDTYLPAYS